MQMTNKELEKNANTRTIHRRNAKETYTQQAFGMRHSLTQLYTQQEHRLRRSFINQSITKPILATSRSHKPDRLKDKPIDHQLTSKLGCVGLSHLLCFHQLKTDFHFINFPPLRFEYELLAFCLENSYEREYSRELMALHYLSLLIFIFLNR